MKRIRKSFEKRKSIEGLILVIPWIIGFLAFTAYPIIYSVYLSLNKVLITPHGIKTNFALFDNYRIALFSDPDFITRLLLFVRILVLSVPIIVVFSLFMAMLINNRIKGRGLFRAIFFLPVIITSSEVANELFQQGAGSIPLVEQYGIVDYINTSLPPFFAAPLTEVVTQLIMMLWFSGVQILIFLAGLQKINHSIYEAASIDGASAWEAFWKITLPYLKPFIMVNAVYTIVNLCTSNLNSIIVKIKVEMFRIETGYGYATAVAWLYFLTVFVLILVAVLLFGREDADEWVKKRKQKKQMKKASAAKGG